VKSRCTIAGQPRNETKSEFAQPKPIPFPDTFPGQTQAGQSIAMSAKMNLPMAALSVARHHHHHGHHFDGRADF